MPPALLRFFSSSSEDKTGAPPNKTGTDSTVAADELEIDVLRSRNLELQQQLKESRAQEKILRIQLEELRIRLSSAEEAEEHLCSQLGDFEAEAVQEDHHYNLQLADLKRRLSDAENLLSAARAELERHRS